VKKKKLKTKRTRKVSKQKNRVISRRRTKRRRKKPAQKIK
jgi:hypothetical protein